MDNECIDFAKVKDDHDYRPYYDAYKQGFLKESEIDTALIRLFTARMKLGMFDPPEMVPYTKIDEKELDSAEHRALARSIANESMVLLKNDGTLPLKQGKLKIALVGPLADQTKYLLGNYSGSPTHIVSVLDGMKAEFPEAQINFVAGTQFLRADGELVPESALTNAEGQPGLTAKFSSGVDPGQGPVLATRTVSTVDLNSESVPQEAAGTYPLSVEWAGFLTVNETGDYSIGVRASGNFAMVLVDGKPLVMQYLDSERSQSKVGHIHLEQGRKTALEVRYRQTKPGPTQAQLIWAKYDPKPDPAAIEAAKNADVVVAVMGITSQLEGEEMAVSEEGFKGGDRTSIDLPKPEQAVARSADGHGEASRTRARQRKRPRRELGTRTRERDSGILVCGRGRWRGGCGNALGEEQSRRPPAGYFLYRHRSTPAV